MWNMSIPWWEFILRGLAQFMSHHVTDDGKREIGQVLPFDLCFASRDHQRGADSMNAGDDSVMAE